MDSDVYKKVCGEQNIDDVLEALKEGVEIFGENKVCSNFIIGLGESDESAKRGIDKLVSMGVIPILRSANIHPLREGEVFIERPSAERLLMLNRYLKVKLDEQGLRADKFQTMCLPCAGCDINPHVDLD
jgi:biotin synthase-related radical SAM superfamily protein